MCKLINLTLIAVLFFSYTTPTLSQDQPFEERLKSAIAQFRHENYDEALLAFKTLNTEDPHSSIVSYYLGLTYKRMENYTESKKYLENSLYMEPKIKGALIELIDVLYRLGETGQAKKWIKLAEDEGVRPAQAAFLKGLTLLKEGKYEEAIRSFEDAKSLDAQFSQLADFQIASAYTRLEKFREAKNIYKNIISLDPQTDVAQYASVYVDALDRRMEKEKPLNILLRFGFEYDSNVILKPADTALVTSITDKDDTRQVWDLRTDYTFKTKDSPLSLRTEYDLHVSKQNDFGAYDTITNAFLLQPAVSFEKLYVAFPVNWSHSVVDHKNYVWTLSMGNVNNFQVGDMQIGQLAFYYKYDDYMRPPYGPEDRTGNELIGTAGFFWFFAKREGFFNLKYSFNKDWTRGSNWEYWGNRIDAGILIPFWKYFKFNVQGEAFLQFFDNVNTFYDKKRQDQVYSVSSMFSYEIIKDLEIQFQYTYVNDQSNLSIYQYDRHVIGGGVQYRF